MNKKIRQQNESSEKMKIINIKNTFDSKEENLKNKIKPVNKYKEEWQQKIYDSENEIMKFSDDEYSNDEKEKENFIISNINSVQKNFSLPNEKAWGKKKKSYYSTDYIDADYSSVSQKNIVDAELEEQEAVNLQQRLAKCLNELDFGLDLIISKDYKCNKDHEHIKTDLSKLNKRQKQELLVKEYPEFKSMITDIKDQLIEAKILLGPFLNLVDKFNCEKCFSIDFLRIKYDLLLHYCTNISFYFSLKAKKEVTFTHPVIKRLTQYRKLLFQLEKYEGIFLGKIKSLLKLNINGQPICNANKIKMCIENKNIQKLQDYSKDHQIIKNIENKNYKVICNVHSNIEQKNSEFKRIIECSNKKDNKVKNIIVQTEKRAITYQIAKNKGLTPYRKKEQRNPRIKHRNKYRKAKICRKGAIREVKKENTRYDGEISGIKTSVKKSVKLK